MLLLIFKPIDFAIDIYALLLYYYFTSVYENALMGKNTTLSFQVKDYEGYFVV